MRTRLWVVFAVAWLLLAATAVAKAISLGSPDLILTRNDPILGLRVSTVMLLAAALEILVCVALLVLRDEYDRGLLLLGLGIQFLTYHGARLVISPHGPCPCLGSAWKWLALSEAGANRLAVGVTLVISVAGLLLMIGHDRCPKTP